MWVAKRLDMPWRLLRRGLAHTMGRADGEVAATRLERLWSPGGEGVAALSVRSALDLYLSAANLPAGSEVLMSALTLDDMRRVVEAHRLTPIPLDLDIDRLEPSIAEAGRLLTPRTRAVVIAHLFGGRIDLRPWSDWCRAHGLLLLEDCAQAFDGLHFTGHAGADVSLFSFGPIKTATALGGALATVRDPEMAARMRDLQSSWPLQEVSGYRRRVLNYAALKAASHPVPYGLIRRRRPRLGASTGGALRNFPGRELLAEIRRQPCAALLATLHDGLSEFDQNSLSRRIEKAVRLHDALDCAVCCPGFALRPHNHWVFPVLVEQPERLVTALAKSGFDSVLAASMTAVRPPVDRPHLAAQRVRSIANRMVYLPCYPELPDEEIERMAAVVQATMHVPRAFSRGARASRSQGGRVGYT
jgi:perosamine synthetase